MTPEQDRQLSRQSRIVAVVIAATGVIWLVGQALVQRYGWGSSYAILFDLAGLAAFFWALVVIFQIWRKRRED